MKNINPIEMILKDNRDLQADPTNNGIVHMTIKIHIVSKLSD